MGKVTKPKEDMIPKTTGGRIEYIRRTALVSQKELADILGVKREYLSMIEADDRIPKVDMIKTISQKFNVTCDFLLCCSDIAAPDESKQAAIKRLGLSEKAQENLEDIMKYLSKYADAYAREDINIVIPADTESETGESLEYSFNAEWKYALYEDTILGLNLLLTTEQGIKILRQLDTMFSANLSHDEKNMAFAEIIDYLSQLKNLHKREELEDYGSD